MECVSTSPVAAWGIEIKTGGGTKDTDTEKQLDRYSRTGRDHGHPGDYDGEPSSPRTYLAGLRRARRRPLVTDQVTISGRRARRTDRSPGGGEHDDESARDPQRSHGAGERSDS